MNKHDMIYTVQFVFFIAVSEAPKPTVAAKKFPSYNPDVKSDQQKKEEVRCNFQG